MMGASNFMTYELGKTLSDAFDRAVQDAQYWHGHGGYTGTIAEKTGYVYFGEVSSRHVDRLETYFFKAETWDWNGRKAKAPRGIPESIRDQILRALDVYGDKWGPAVAFQLTGSRAKEIKEAKGRKGTHDKVFVFLGLASL